LSPRGDENGASPMAHRTHAPNGAKGNPLRRHVLIALAALGTPLLIGTVGYVVLEGWPWFDALYMTVITLATIGYGETHPLSPAGRAFTMVLIALGVGTVAYLASVAGRALVEQWLGEVFWRSRMRHEIEKLKGHYIVCGAGQVGQLVRRELAAAGAPHLVIDRDPVTVGRLVADGVLALAGDATDQAMLEQARIQLAKGLVAVLPSDADNVYVAMTARDLNPTLPIVARATDEAVAPKLQRAGASRVVLPDVTGGRQIVQALLSPDVLDFLDLATGRDNLTLQLEQVRVGAGSELVRHRVVVGQMRNLHRVSVVALRKRDGSLFDIPKSESAIEPGDTLIVVGRAEDCRSVAALAGGNPGYAS